MQRWLGVAVTREPATVWRWLSQPPRVPIGWRYGPFLRCETQRWVKRAEAIPDQTLRRIALDALRLKRGNLEGAVAFAALARGQHRLPSARAMAAYEAAFDYLDCLCECPATIRSPTVASSTRP